MFLPELYFGCQNNNSLEASPSFVEKHDCSQSKYPGRIGKTCEGERSSFYYCVPSSNCVCQPQHAIIDDSVIYEGDSCPATAYAHHLNAVNVISNSFPIHHDHDQNSSEMNENNSLEISPAECIRKQSEPCAFNLHEGGNIQDSIEEKSYSFNAVNNKGKRKPRVDAETAARRKAHIDFQVKRTTRSQISGALGSMDRHSKVLTSKGPRDRRIRLAVGTAIKLYCLQESLGFDQPSKAVEWLIKNSQASIRELPQVSSISCSDISPHVDSDRSTAVCVSCHQTGELSTLSQDNTCSTASRDCVVNPHDQILAANSCLCQKSSTATTIESNNRGSMVQGEKREQRTMVMSSVSSRITRSTANDVRRRKEFRAKARERARERTKKKEKRYNQDCGIYGLLRPSSVPPQFSAFSLQDNSTSASSLNMINETTGAYSNRFGFRHSFMSPKPFHLCSTCISSPPTQIQSSLASVHYSSTQQEDISIQSTGALSSSDPEVIPVTSDSFPQAVATANNCSSHCVFCSYPPDHAHLNSSNLYGSCREESIEMTGTYDSGLDTPFQRQSTRKKETFQELHSNEEIPCLKSPNEYVPFGSIMSNPYSYHGIFGLLQ